MKHYEYISSSMEETIEFGKRLGNLLTPSTVILLDGDLGAGKTTFTKGIGQGLEIKKHITSPTFNILKIYKGRLPLYHIDAYRLEGANQDLGFDEFLDDDGVTVIEWSQFAPQLIPPEYLFIKISLEPDFTRKFEIDAYGTMYENLLEELA